METWNWHFIKITFLNEMQSLDSELGSEQRPRPPQVANFLLGTLLFFVCVIFYFFLSFKWWFQSHIHQFINNKSTRDQFLSFTLSTLSNELQRKHWNFISQTLCCTSESGKKKIWPQEGGTERGTERGTEGSRERQMQNELRTGNSEVGELWSLDRRITRRGKQSVA